MYLAGVVSEDGVIDGALAAVTPRVEAVGRTFSYVLREGEPRLVIHQTDVRAIQLAKAALYAGAQLLIERLGAGSPQAHHARGRLRQPYRSALCDGARHDPRLRSRRMSPRPATPPASARASRLLNRASRAEIEEVVRQIEKIETAIEPRFQEHFVAAMAIPNKVEPFPNLAKAVALPERKAPAETGRRRRR